jgi:hypothetical protein
MPEEKYGYRPAEGKFKNESRSSALLSCEPSPNRSST